MNKVAYSLKEAAQVLGISLPTMYEIARRDDFPAVRVSARRIVVPVEALNRWLDQQARHGAQV